MIEIQKNAPLPKRRQWAATFRAMAVGDSIFVPFSEGGVNLRFTVPAWNARNRDVHFTSRVDEVNQGVRVWRDR